MLQAQYVDLKFESKEKFEKWLQRKTKFIIEFEDCGQDFLYWYLDKKGEVLDSKPFQARIWNGSMINLLKLDIGKFPEFRKHDEQFTLNYRVIKITEL